MNQRLIDYIERRVKCDETRPACLRCTSGGRICDGYHHVTQPQHSSSIIVPFKTNPFFDIYASSESNRSFACFVQRTCPQLSGFFGCEFWERLVLQAAYHEPAIRHAAIAIGALHQQLDQHSNTRKTFALEQYNLAIRDLLLPLSQGEKSGVDICLIACVLFTCFEVCLVFTS
jgi:hypothetical protein